MRALAGGIAGGSKATLKKAEKAAQGELCSRSQNTICTPRRGSFAAGSCRLLALGTQPLWREYGQTVNTLRSLGRSTEVWAHHSQFGWLDTLKGVIRTWSDLAKLGRAAFSVSTS